MEKNNTDKKQTAFKIAGIVAAVFLGAAILLHGFGMGRHWMGGNGMWGHGMGAAAPYAYGHGGGFGHHH